MAKLSHGECSSFGFIVASVAGCLGGPGKKKVIHLYLQQDSSLHFPLRRCGVSGGPLKEATVLRWEGTTGSRLNKVVALGGQNWCVKRKPSPSKVAAQPHTYSTARCTMGLSDRSLEKRPHVFGLSKLNGCTVLPVYPCIIKVHCYLFYWQLPILRACQKKAKTAAQQSRKTTLVKRRGRNAGLKTKRERVAFGWEA